MAPPRAHGSHANNGGVLRDPAHLETGSLACETRTFSVLLEDVGVGDERDQRDEHQETKRVHFGFHLRICTTA